MSHTMSAGFIETKSSRLQNRSALEFKEVTFVSHKPKPKQLLEASPLPQSSKLRNVAGDIDMKKARSEIMQFAIGGMEGQEKRQSKRALAISLGAIPEKSKKVNYKVLKVQRKKKELARSNDTQTLNSSHQKSLLSCKVSNRKTLSKSGKNKKSDILGVYGKVNKKDLHT